VCVCVCVCVCVRVRFVSQYYLLCSLTAINVSYFNGLGQVLAVTYEQNVIYILTLLTYSLTHLTHSIQQRPSREANRVIN